MSITRAFAIVAGLSALCACGGGGSGTTTPGSLDVPPPVTSPPPSGNGAPTGMPTSTPLPTLSPGSTMSPVPTVTPTPAIASSQTIVTHQGSVSGQTGEFGSLEGDTSTGGQGAPIDNILCQPVMSNNYHIHIYLGVFVNGNQAAIPLGLGMENPALPSLGFVNSASCFYFTHTHDSSGIVHVEDPNPNNVPITSSMFTLQNVLDVWGITADSSHFGPFVGPVEVFTSGQVYRGNSNGATVPATTLLYYGSNPNSIPLYSHEVIFVEVGPTYPASLPGVHFYIQY